MKHIKGLDTLRALAVFFVIIAHWGPYFNNINDFGRFIQIFLIPDGATAVYFFFVLSGFLITTILLNARDADTIPERFSALKNFIIRRALRIFPIYYLLIFFLYAINYPDVRANMLYYVTYTSNIQCYRANGWNSLSHTWTLAIEEQFYLIWPWLILFLNKKYLKYLFFGSVLLGILTTYLVYNIKHSIEPFLVFNCFDAFGIGGLYAFVRQDERACRKFERIVKVAFPFMLICYFYWKTAFYFYQVQHAYSLQKTVNSMIAVWLIIQVINNKSERLRKRLWENRFLNFIGKISYGIYLYHVPFLVIVGAPVKNLIDDYAKHFPPLTNEWAGFFVCYFIDLALLLLLSWVSFRYIEKPLLNFKRFFRYSDKKTQR